MNFYKTMIIVLLAATGNCTLYAQLIGRPKLDSMLKELHARKEDTANGKLLSLISFEYAYINPDSGLLYARKLLELAEPLRWKSGLALANGKMAFNLSAKSEYIEALKYANEAARLFEETGEKRNLAITLMDVGTIYRRQSSLPKALAYFLQALKIGEELNDDLLLANFRMSIANVKVDLGLYADALKYYSEALKAAERTGNRLLTGKIYGNMGGVERALKHYQKALEYYAENMAVAQEYGDRNSIAMLTENIASVYTDQGNFTMALDHHIRAMELNRELGNKSAVAICYNNIGETYLRIVGYISSSPSKTLLNAEGSTSGYSPTGRLPYDIPILLDRAIEALQEGAAIAHEIHSPGILENSYRGLMKVFAQKGDFKKALEYSDNYRNLHDSLFSAENKEEILKLELKNDYDRQRLTDSLKTAEKEKIAAINLQKQKSYTYLGIAGIMLLAGFSFFIIKERGKSETARKQSDNLLLNILPEEVAGELKTTGTTTAKHYDNVTVLFTDFVNFTQAGENLSPQNLIDELHTCFKAFDEITHKYNIEKIKTIGDAYLAVCGLPTADPKHAEFVVRAAIEINAFMQDRLAKMGSERTFAVRIGIHSGSVVAGIVGVKKFAYDIWGDTVNTAARMEQNSEAGKINISETTYELVKDKFSCEYRGEVEAKGKGVMKMYFVS